MTGTTRVKSGAVEVEGLREAVKALKALDDKAPGELRDASKGIAEDVAGKAKARASSLGGVAAHVAPTISARAGATSAGVGLGGAGNPEAMGAEFGGGRRPTTQQFQPWRGNGESAGYFVYPTIRDESDHIVDQFTDAIDDLTRKLGLS